MRAQQAFAARTFPFLFLFPDERPYSRFTDPAEVCDGALAVFQGISFVQIFDAFARIIRALIAKL